MANTTDIVITCFIAEDHAIAYINQKTGLDLKLISDGLKAGGCNKHIAFDTFGAVYRCLEEEQITDLIETFKTAPFDTSNLAVLLIDNDNETFSGIVTITES